MKTYISILILLFPFCTFAQKKSTKTEQAPQIILVEKNPATSFILSALIPGTGQLYNNQVGKGITFFLIDAPLLIAGNSILDEEKQGLKNSLLIAGATLYLIQLIEAPIATKKLNVKRGFSKLKPIVVPTNNYALTYGFSYRF
jgi:hypothetical protein